MKIVLKQSDLDKDYIVILDVDAVLEIKDMNQNNLKFFFEKKSKKLKIVANVISFPIEIFYI